MQHLKFSSWSNEHYNLMKLPNIMFVNRQVYEEWRSMIFSHSTYVLDVRHHLGRELVQSFQVSTRGLRANKETTESMAYVQEIAQFSKVILMIGTISFYTSSAASTMFSVKTLLAFLKINGLSYQTIILDAFYLFREYDWVTIYNRDTYHPKINVGAAIKMLEDTEELMELSPRFRLRPLNADQASRKWGREAYNLIKAIYARTDQIMLEPGAILSLEGT